MERSIADLCTAVAVSYETEYGDPMNGQRVGYVVGSFLEGFVSTPGSTGILPDHITEVLLEIAEVVREGTTPDIRLYHFPYVLEAIRLYCDDPKAECVVPVKWRSQMHHANEELKALRHDQIETLVNGDDVKREHLVRFCPAADEVLSCVFNGELYVLSGAPR